MEIKKLVATLHPLERKVVPFLDKAKSLTEIEEQTGMQNVEVMRALQWLQNKKVLLIKEEIKKVVKLDKNGKEYASKGLPEKRFLAVIYKKTPVDEAVSEAGIGKDEMGACLGILKGKAAITVEKGKKGMLLSITPAGKKLLSQESLEEKFLKTLTTERDVEKIEAEEKFALDNLAKRKQIVKQEIKKERLIELTELGEKLVKEKITGDFVDRLTPEMLKTSTWKKKEFRAYDVKINVPQISGGKRHFVNQAISYIKRIWLDLGFKEMTGQLVQTSFWDLDSLFVPQDHPARSMQDTFYLKNPAKGKLPKELLNKIKTVHENGANTGSKGWQAPWNSEVAKELLLRTHTTVLSAKTISALKQKDLPQKFFSVNRVYRNEMLNWKHLFEFNQVEGIVVDPKANFKHLKGYLREFFTKMGFPDVRIRPGHFPYTEPSAEIDVMHPEKNEWVELGGSGIFRPEVTKPLMGIEVPVLAWGFGLERTISAYYGITDIRDLYNNNLKKLKEIKFWMK